MSTQDFTIPNHYVLAALRGPKENGFDVALLLKQAGISPDVLTEPMAPVTAAQYSLLIKHIWLTMKDEYMGLSPEPSALGTFSMMCHAVIHCPTLEKAMSRAFRFYGLFPNLPRLELVVLGEEAQIVLHDEKLNDPDHFLVESLLVIWHRYCSWLIGRRIHLLKTQLRYPAPEHQSEYRRLFHCDIEFSAGQTAFTFPVKFLHEKIVQTETSLRQFLIHSPADLLARPDEGNSLVAQIRKIIGSDLSQELPNFEDIADALHMSVQTLRRRLKDEGLTYQELKDQMRRDTAVYYLERGDLSIQEVAEKLGFSESSTFHRAFKKWTGMTPGAYREGEEHLER